MNTRPDVPCAGPLRAAVAVLNNTACGRAGGWAGVWIPNVPVSDDTTATAMLPSNAALYTRNLPETWGARPRMRSTTHSASVQGLIAKSREHTARHVLLRENVSSDFMK